MEDLAFFPRWLVLLVLCIAEEIFEVWWVGVYYCGVSGQVLSFPSYFGLYSFKLCWFSFWGLRVIVSGYEIPMTGWVSRQGCFISLHVVSSSELLVWAWFWGLRLFVFQFNRLIVGLVARRECFNSLHVIFDSELLSFSILDSGQFYGWMTLQVGVPNWQQFYKQSNGFC